MKDAWETWHRRNSIAQLLHIYIPSDCSNSQNYSDGLRSPLNKVVQDFLAHKEQKLLLVLGDSGSGKTSLTLKLEEEYWNSHSEVQYIPIRIELRSFTTKTVKQCVEETLKKQYKLLEEDIEQLKKNKNIRLIVLFDGYDEIGGRAEFNLYDGSGLRDWDCEIKMIVTSRAQHFGKQDDFEHYFILHEKVMNTKLRESLRLIYVAPFSEAQMNQYLIQYSDKHNEEDNDLKFPLEDIQRLLKTQVEFKDLLSSPLVLKMFSEIALKFLNGTNQLQIERIKKIRRAEIYQVFLEDWLEREKEKLESSVRKSELRDKIKDVEKYFSQYARQLAFLYYKTDITELRYEEIKSEWSEFQDRELVQEGNTVFKEFFESEKSEVVEARKACPLRRSGDNTYSFVHKSFQDYLAARHLYLVLKSGNEKLMLENWNARYLSEDRAVLRFLAELIENDLERKKLEERLLKVIKGSSQKEDSDMASSNAISVLNWNRYSFSGMDLHGIRIPNSYLEGVNFSGANLSKSNLSGSYVKNGEWSEANLEGSNLKELTFGEYPDWEQGSRVLCLALNAKGTLVATGDDEGYLRLWRYPEGELVRSWKGHKAGIHSVSFSEDEKRLASGADDRTVRLWNAESDLEERVLVGHTGIVMSVSFSCDGKWLASGSDDKTIRLWDLESGLEERVLIGHTSYLTSVSFSRDGKRLASSAYDRTVRIWDVESGLEKRVLVGHTDIVTSVSFSRDSKRLASGSFDKTVQIWDVERGLEERVLVGHTRAVTSVSFSRDGKRLASGSFDKTVQIWDVESGLEERALIGHTNIVRSVNFSRDGKRLASGSEDGTVRIWDVESGIEERVLVGHTNIVRSVSFSRDAKRLASGSEDGTVRIWDVESGIEERVLVGHTNIVTSVSSSRDGKRLASGSEDGTVRIWDVERGLEERVLVGHTNIVTSVSFSRNGKRLASGSSRDATVRVWDVESGIEERKLVGHTDFVTSVSFSREGKRLVIGSDREILLWDFESGLVERVLVGHTAVVTSVSFSRDGKRLASGDYDGKIRLWDFENGLVERVLVGHTNRVKSVNFSRDGKRLASGGDDRTIRIWDVEGGECIGVAVFNQEVRSVSFYKSRDGKKEYLGAGIGNGVCVFCVEERELDKKPRLILKWRTDYYLRAQNANLENALIDDANRRLLEQRGALKTNSKAEKIKSDICISLPKPDATGTTSFFAANNPDSSKDLPQKEERQSKKLSK